ncbi:serine/threonine protein kinase [Caminicella sporogenes DSM 14501]|uniref:Serine/threonine protein kinase n=1 Tax=Caminicella sporogenes DSM 14501 TaxID=1121266 RepID=A0A1M6QS02_9FIRM|nr:protein kinase [Caminicella sporogenes]RKD20930.1 hypothetical protein BET04_08875 [Caminicella sporogenes]SHK23089.1 serine/threonine protein kinase [Caminicella sporogenes DSM 14501]
MDFRGIEIVGKWNKKTYIIKKLIGTGGVGKVYKVYDAKSKEYYALKISMDLCSITKEANMLDKFKDFEFIPKIIDIDDCEINGKMYHFIVLEYIEGKNLKEYTKKYRINIKELLGIAIIVCEAIDRFHKRGYVFGDLKPENLMIDEKKKKLKIIDLGGVSKIGLGLKEFTPLYDRAKWNMGLRKADPAYDLFSICMFLTCFILESNSKILNMDINSMICELKRKGINQKLINLIKDGLFQRQIDFSIFLKRLKKIYVNGSLKRDKKYKNKINLIVNIYFISSLLCLITMLLFLLSKSLTNIV